MTNDQRLYRPHIDGLRALAVLSVMGFHAKLPGFAGGFVGVDAFFVISGYLITGIIVAAIDAGDFSLAVFWERRARRILPALYLVLALSIIPATWLAMPPQLLTYGTSLAASAVFASNLHFVRMTGYFDPALVDMPLIHIWSLSVEEQFYLLYPLGMVMVAYLRRSLLPTVIWTALLLSLASSEYLVRSGHSAASFFLLPPRAWELLAGAVMALRPPRNSSGDGADLFHQLASLSGIALILCSVVLIDESTPFPGVVAIAPVLGAMLTIRCARKGTIAHRVLAHPMLVGIGLISYSAYLWHQPLLVAAQWASLTPLTLVQRFGILVLTFALAFLTWRFIETPFRDRARVSRQTVVRMAVGVGAALLAAGILLRLTGGLPTRFPEEWRAYDRARAAELAWINRCAFSRERSLATEQPCVVGTRGAVTTAVIGDSHASSIMAPIADLMEGRGERAVLLGASGCPPWMSVQFSTSMQYCVPHQQEVLTYLARHPGITRVVIAARWTYHLTHTRYDNGEGGVEPIGALEATPFSAADSERMAMGFRHLVDELVEYRKTVILIYPIPEAGWDVPVQVGRQYLLAGPAISDLSTSSDRFVQRNRDAYRFLDSLGPSTMVRRFYPARNLCNTRVPRRCLVANGDTPLYGDDDHLTSAGARLALRGIDASIYGTTAAPR